MNNLGDRLRKADVSADEDLELLATLRLDYDGPMNRVRDQVERLADATAAVVPRLKTTATIVEKLKREATRLATMQDIAGVRLVADMTLSDQDRIVRRVTRSFNVLKDYDLRDNPRYGYRAVHVIVEEDECPVEIQIRTEIQNSWAQAMEGLTDIFGREIKYELPDTTPPLLRKTVARMIERSEVLARIERNGDRAERVETEIESTLDEPDSLERQAALAALSDEWAEVEAEDKAIGDALEADRVAFQELLEEVELMEDEA